MSILESGVINVEEAAQAEIETIVVVNPQRTGEGNEFPLPREDIIKYGFKVFNGLKGELYSFLKHLVEGKKFTHHGYINSSKSCAEWFFASCFVYSDFYLNNKEDLMILLHYLTREKYDKVVHEFKICERRNPIVHRRES